MKIDSDKLKRLLIQKKMSWTELSQKSGISIQHLGRITNNKVNSTQIKTIGAICKALDVDDLNLLI